MAEDPGFAQQDLPHLVFFDYNYTFVDSKKVVPKEHRFFEPDTLFETFEGPGKVIIGTKWVHINPHGPIVGKLGAKYTHKAF